EPGAWCGNQSHISVWVEPGRVQSGKRLALLALAKQQLVFNDSMTAVEEPTNQEVFMGNLQVNLGLVQRKSKQALRDYKKVLLQLETLEINVGDQCRKEFS
ncbi:plexin-B1, partial [Lates japonicus]